MAHAVRLVATHKGVGRKFSRKGLQGRALTPSHFSNSGGGGSIPIFGCFNGKKESIFWARGHGPPLPMPAYDYGKALRTYGSKQGVQHEGRGNFTY